MGNTMTSSRFHVNGVALSVHSTKPTVNTEIKFMGKSYKDAPWKFKKDKNFQKKQKQKNKGKQSAGFRGMDGWHPNLTTLDSGTDMGVQGCDDFETGP